MDLLWGWAVIIAAVMAVALVVKYAALIDRLDPDNQPDTEDEPTDVLDPGATQVIRVGHLVVVDPKTGDDEEPDVISGELVDELGAWKPWEHTMEQPLILAEVLMAGSWEGLRANELGMMAA